MALSSLACAHSSLNLDCGVCLRVRQALCAPAALIAQNAGVEGAVIVEKIKESPWEVGYNAMADKFEDLLVAGEAPLQFCTPVLYHLCT